MAPVSKHIRQLRTARGMTQEELAQKLYVTRQTISAWETGRSQPDLGTLEQIAAALGVEVTEVIYGTPQNQDLGPVKRKWALLGGSVVLVLAILLLTAIKCGLWGTWRGGFQYQLGDPSYYITYEPLRESCSLEIDLRDLESNVGKVLYEDEAGCRIVVDGIDTNGTDGSQHRIWFRSHGVYDRSGGTLVTGSLPVQTGSAAWRLETESTAQGSAGERTARCPIAGGSAMNRKDGTDFGFYLTGPHSHTLSTEEVLGAGGIMTITVSDLTRMRSQRMQFWDDY